MYIKILFNLRFTHSKSDTQCYTMIPCTASQCLVKPISWSGSVLAKGYWINLTRLFHNQELLPLSSDEEEQIERLFKLKFRYRYLSDSVIVSVQLVVVVQLVAVAVVIVAAALVDCDYC